MAGTPKADPRANPAARPPPVRPPERTRGGAEQNLGIRPGPPRSAHGDPARDRGPPDRTGEVRRLPGPAGIEREMERWQQPERRILDARQSLADERRRLDDALAKLEQPVPYYDALTRQLE